MAPGTTQRLLKIFTAENLSTGDDSELVTRISVYHESNKGSILHEVEQQGVELLTRVYRHPVVDVLNALVSPCFRNEIT